MAVLPKLTGLKKQTGPPQTKKHQIIKVPMTRMMQIPFYTDDRLEVAVRQVLRHVHPVLGVSILMRTIFIKTISISLQYFDFGIVVCDKTVVLVITEC